MDETIWVISIGIGATVIMDLWGVIRQFIFGIPINYDFLGRWIGSMINGRFLHQNIAASPSIHGERIIGWITHYLTGITFSVLLILIWGNEWLHKPTLMPAISAGLVTVMFPFLVMLPCMGAGIAASKTPSPMTTRIHSLIIHMVFGFGLYSSGWIYHLL